MNDDFLRHLERQRKMWKFLWVLANLCLLVLLGFVVLLFATYLLVK